MAQQAKSDEERAPGTTTIAPNVLVTIAQLTALRVEGVADLAPIRPGVNKLFRRGVGEGVDIRLENGEVTADMYLVMDSGVNVREVSRNVQKEIARAIEEMVGLSAASIHVHIQDIQTPET
jgi:uncharacterized alkaline shock family protein YloU